MLDTLYIVGTIAFFALMVLYVRACESLGARHDADEQSPWPPRCSSPASSRWACWCTSCTRCCGRSGS